MCGTCSTGRASLPHATDTKAVRVCDECLPPPNLTPSTSIPISSPTFSYSSSDQANTLAVASATPLSSSSVAPISVVPNANPTPAPTSPSARQNVAQIMKDSASLSRVSSRIGIKPPSTPLPPTPQHGQQPPSYAPPVPVGSQSKSSKPMPPVPQAALKRSFSTGIHQLIVFLHFM